MFIFCKPSEAITFACLTRQIVFRRANLSLKALKHCNEGSSEGKKVEAPAKTIANDVTASALSQTF